MRASPALPHNHPRHPRRLAALPLPCSLALRPTCRAASACCWTSTTAAAPRALRFKLLQGSRGRRQAVEALCLTDGLVLMDEVAAGSGQLGSLLHGRYGDGATISVDLALPDLSRQAGLGNLWNGPVRRCVGFFDPKNPKGHPYEDEGQQGARHGGGKVEVGAAAAARSAAAQAPLQQQQQQEGEAGEAPRLHCYWCHSLRPGPPPKKGNSQGPSWYRGADPQDPTGQPHRWCAACNFRRSKDTLPRPRPAAQLCPDGCAGCAGGLPVPPAAPNPHAARPNRPRAPARCRTRPRNKCLGCGSCGSAPRCR